MDVKEAYKFECVINCQFSQKKLMLLFNNCHNQLILNHDRVAC